MNPRQKIDWSCETIQLTTDMRITQDVHCMFPLEVDGTKYPDYVFRSAANTRLLMEFGNVTFNTNGELRQNDRVVSSTYGKPFVNNAEDIGRVKLVKIFFNTKFLRKAWSLRVQSV